MNNKAVAVRVSNGVVEFINESGFTTGNKLMGSDWVNAYMSGNSVIATNKKGKTTMYDDRGVKVRDLN